MLQWWLCVDTLSIVVDAVVLRVKGGVTDYCVIGEINIHALREFQSSYRSSAKGFKPVPDGFADDMAYDRKVLPKGE